MNIKQIGLQVARLTIWFDASSSNINLALPENYDRFTIPWLLDDIAKIPVTKSVLPGSDNLILKVQHDPLFDRRKWGVPLFQADNWEIWKDPDGSLSFVSPRENPGMRIRVEPGFTSGQVIGDFSSIDDLDPMQDLGIKVFINWLAYKGDILLHASGVMIDNNGYCFVGQSGAGKSTAATLLSNNPLITILGEDQVVLRFIDGRFWIFGTPWHLNPDMFSPEGVPLKEVLFLEKKGEEKNTEITASDGVTRLVQTAFIPYYQPQWIPGILDRFSLLTEKVRFCSLSFKLDSDILKMITSP
jgi:hypothetical protein